MSKLLAPEDQEWQDIETYLNDKYFSGAPPVLLGDVNLDGVVNGLDVDPFVALVSGGGSQDEADMNGDGAVNGLDVDPFVTVVVGGGAAAVPEPTTLLLATLAALGLRAFRSRQQER